MNMDEVGGAGAKGVVSAARPPRQNGGRCRGNGNGDACPGLERAFNNAAAAAAKAAAAPPPARPGQEDPPPAKAVPGRPRGGGGTRRVPLLPPPTTTKRPRPPDAARLRRGTAAAAASSPGPGRARRTERGLARLADLWEDEQERSWKRQKDFIFRAPITISKPGELHEEYKSHLRKWRGDRAQEERASEDRIHKPIVEEADAGRKKTDDPESSTVRMTQEHFPERLSDSENEEPFRGKSAHRSAFVSKGSTYSMVLPAGNLIAKVERSQSCNDTLRDRSKSRQRAASVRTKVHPVIGGSAPLLGVLSSTQNNRCLSAPDLTADKRLILSSAAAPFSLLPKPERSVSPESNDSISEELNHFKPIVCSPCTPPKRLPDGRVLSPLIIKSTPRNLTRSLQKPTTYEASPRILKKWEQIFQDRQVKRTLSKATLTSAAPEAGGDSLAPSMDLQVKDPPLVSQGLPLTDPLARTQAELEVFSSVCVAKLEGSCKVERGTGVTDDAGPPAPAVRLNKNTLSARTSGFSDAQPTLHVAGSFLNIGANLVAQKVMRTGSDLPGKGLLGTPAKAVGKKQLKCPSDCELSSFPNGVCLEKASGEDPSSLRWGRKRQCKMKHLEQAGSVKRLRQQAPGPGGWAASDPLRRKSEADRKRRLQEEGDRRLAVELQRKFDTENRRAARRKGRADQYFLRSKSTMSAGSS